MMAVRYPEKYFFTEAQREREEAAQAFLPEFLEKQANAAWKRIHSAPVSPRSQTVRRVRMRRARATSVASNG